MCFVDRRDAANPEAIHRHSAHASREIYRNTVYADEADEEGCLHIIVVVRHPFGLKFWTSFQPRRPDA